MSDVFTVMFTGVYTVATTLTAATYYLMRDENFLRKLQQELAMAWPDATQPCPSATVLEKLPYLSAVIKETLRLTAGVNSPIPRITPETGMTIAGTYVPGGVQVSSSSYIIHHDRRVFRNPCQFDSSRWVVGGKEMQKFELSFSIGPRQCPAMSWSMNALLVSLAHVMRSFEFDYEDQGDLRYKDYFVPIIDGPNLRGRVRRR
ncbi:hypothetical protein ASPACDRAFT_126465 [Aspergillus aculeatus ATCC 16872]|uniref:Cytochrome P450 n=1 Tax=Aspergillus aculeatus (strain ATCC 16872 / CBS 172.66 / WB 5094) TaxID=690307 RepID=A0A1L9WHK6_ASPA1|nr:uncharacterized protein ASPACDRAFT_126465 [Aspergillus aculeatus ATCC 16872]OJJ95674.1 hypothetical protein ASPACDRAFT_126465 [Aspergillus aculeatus ATCC 16872]